MTIYQHSNPYPLPRTNRAAGIPTVSGQDVGLDSPKVYLWAIHLRESGIPSRATVISKKINGPAFIDEASLEFSFSTGAAPLPTLALGYSLSAPPQGADQNAAEIANVVWFYDLHAVEDANPQAPTTPGLMFTAGTARGADHKVRLGFPINTAEFFLIATIRSNAAGASQVNGSIRVLETVPPDLLGELVIA